MACVHATCAYAAHVWLGLAALAPVGPWSGDVELSDQQRTIGHKYKCMIGDSEGHVATSTHSRSPVSPSCAATPESSEVLVAKMMRVDEMTTRAEARALDAGVASGRGGLAVLVHSRSDETPH